MISISGTLERITFQNPDNHYTVARLKVDRLADPITIVGHIGGVGPGEFLTLSGKWGTHPRYGDQFNVRSYEVILPTTLPEIKKYLSSGIIDGMGPGLADRIVTHFGDATLEIIENDPPRLREIRGIGRARQTLIEQSWNAHHGVRRVMKFLQDFDIPALHSGTILKNYGTRAMEVLEADPYTIAPDLGRQGFRIADTIALQTGVSEDHPRRIQAFIIHHLMRCEEDGHVFTGQQEIIDACIRSLGIEAGPVGDALQDLAGRDEIVIDRPAGEDREPRIYLSRLFRAERGIFERIRALLSMPEPEMPLEKDQIVELVLSRLAVKLSPEQLDVVCQALTHRVVIITGGPGTGKTTLIRSICTVFKKLMHTILLSAPTGRAARRLSEVTGKKAFTLHKLLGCDPDSGYFEKNRANPLEADVFIIDEASMVDTPLMYHFLDAVPVQSILILVGDTFQLPSVGPGNVLADMIDSGVIQTFSLTRIFRQARKSPIVMNAHQIRNGDMPDLTPPAPDKPTDFYFIENRSPSKVVDTILDLCGGRIRKAFPHIQEIQVLTPMHKGEAGTINLNQRLQEILNPSGIGLSAGGMTFRPGDKVMHLKNNYEKDVFNGDIGLVLDVSRTAGKLVVEYDGRMVAYELPELDELTLAYTISVHKSQGSEYSAVIVALTMNHRPLLQRNLLYTAITRGRSLVVIVGSKDAFETALANDRTMHRRSGLRQRLDQLTATCGC